jgi:hypothetical protein
LREIKAQHRAEFDRIDADVGRKVEEAEERLLIVEGSDPTDALTIEALQRANAKSPFVADDVQRLSNDALEKRCRRAALSSGDRSTLFLLHHHAAPRGRGPEAPGGPRRTREEARPG